MGANTGMPVSRADLNKIPSFDQKLNKRSSALSKKSSMRQDEKVEEE